MTNKATRATAPATPTPLPLSTTSTSASGDYSAFPAFTRLHITPLDADLLGILLPTSILPKARNVSYHGVQTFPEKHYGFVDLPSEDAERLRKKLHGAILKGVKMRVEMARPSDIPAPLGDEAVAAPTTGTKSDKKGKKKKQQEKDGSRKKRKRGDGPELEGIELEDGRKVKRGWALPDGGRATKEKRSKEEKDKKKPKQHKGKKDARSKYTDHEECLVKTILPPNAAMPASEADGNSGKKRKRGHKSREVVVHEFEKTTKFPTFLKTVAPTCQSNPAVEFVDGKGWIDEHGNVVEAVKTKSGPPKVRSEKKPVEVMAKDSSSSSSSDDSSSEDDDSDESPLPKAGRDSAVEETAQGVAKDGHASSRLIETPSPAARNAMSKTPLSSPSVTLTEPLVARPKSSGSVRSLTIKIPPATPVATKVHPLEALYKRSQQADGAPSQEEAQTTSFSFFGNDVDDNNNDNGNDEDDMEQEDGGYFKTAGSQIPMTPFTRRDWESRGIRSAAPTPDTAHPAQRFKPWANDDDDDIQEEEEVAEDDEVENEAEDMDEDHEQGLEGNEQGKEGRAGTQPGGEGRGGGIKTEEAASDFQSWFWEHRGELNRSWKKRRKTVAKETRYRENRARAKRAV